MSVWVKICANTSLEDARLAADAGADALGFVFAPSPRRVTAEQVSSITPHLPQHIERIGVFIDASFQDIAAAVTKCGLTGVQLHSEFGSELPAQLREAFGPAFRVLRVVHFGPQAAEQVAQFAQDPNVTAVLLDSRTATAVGGTGLTFDWDEAKRSVFSRPGAKLIAAGGLSPDNVQDAIARLTPWGVDVASGVEASPGHKDPDKVRRFVAVARHHSI